MNKRGREVEEEEETNRSLSRQVTHIAAKRRRVSQAVIVNTCINTQANPPQTNETPFTAFIEKNETEKFLDHLTTAMELNDNVIGCLKQILLFISNKMVINTL